MIEIHKGFVSDEVRLPLIKWFDENLYNDKVFDMAFEPTEDDTERRTDRRFSSRRVRSIPFPQSVTDLYGRVGKLVGLRPLEGYFHELAIATLPGVGTYEHYETTTGECLIGNIMIQAAEIGGEFRCEGVNHKIGSGDLFIFNGKSFHGVTKVEGGVNRYVFSFRFLDEFNYLGA